MMSCTDLKFYKEYASKHHSIQGKQTKAQRTLKSRRFSSYFLMSKGWFCQQTQSGLSSNQTHYKVVQQNNVEVVHMFTAPIISGSSN